MPQAQPPPDDSEEKSMPPEAEEKDGGEGGAAEAISDIQEGFQTLSQMMQSAGGQVSPQDVKLFQAAMQATEAFIQSISGPAEPQGPAPKSPGGPMAPNANAQARPSPNQGY